MPQCEFIHNNKCVLEEACKCNQSSSSPQQSTVIEDEMMSVNDWADDEYYPDNDYDNRFPQYSQFGG